MHPTQNPVHPDRTTRRWDGLPETTVERKFFDLRESGWLGWIDQDGNAVFDVDQWKAEHMPPVDRFTRGPVDRPGPAQAAPAETVPVSTVPAMGGTSSAAIAALRAAAEHIEMLGWCQDSWYDRRVSVFDPPACTAGALIIVAYGYPEEDPADNGGPQWMLYDAAFNAFDSYLRDRYGTDLYTWNDQPGRTAAQVIAALREAADLYDTTSRGGAG